ncbi:MAG TPA: EI24 domain-containing protein [bacterium]|nr:EI24 domain-containing protein [bacterium]
MTETGGVPSPLAVTRAGPIALLGAGREAFRQVPGLRWLLIKGFLLLYGLFIVIGAVVMGVVYRFLVQPLSQNLAHLDSAGNFFLDLLLPLANGLVWLGEWLLLAATLLLSLVISLSLLSLWFEALAGRVAAHARGGAATEAPFSLRAWVGSLAHAVRDSALMLGLAVLSLLLGFVPLAGPFLVFGLASYMMGWEVREPYLAVRTTRGENLGALRHGLSWWTLRAGTLPVLLAMVPWLGWLLLPVVLTYQVAGVAWLSERGRA